MFIKLSNFYFTSLVVGKGEVFKFSVEFPQKEKREVTHALDLYRSVGGKLTDSSEVVAIKQILEHDNDGWTKEGYKPFFAIIAPSGSGKTQLPFTLSAAIPLVHISFGFSQPIYEHLESCSRAFIDALTYDMVTHNLGADVSCRNISSPAFRHKLRACAAISFFLGVNPPIECTVEELKTRVADMNAKERPIFFLDEAIPKSPTGHISSTSAGEGEETRVNSGTVDENILRYARNLLRVVGLVVVLMGTDATAANLMSIAVGSRMGEDLSPIWCTVITKLPLPTEASSEVLGSSAAMTKLRKGDHAKLSEYFEEQNRTCLPWFINLLSSIILNDISDEIIVTVPSSILLNRILYHLAQKIVTMKAGLRSRDGLRGQMCAHMSSYNNQRGNLGNVPLFLNPGSDLFVHKHFANLSADNDVVYLKNMTTNLVVSLDKEGKKLGLSWRPVSQFPSPENNSLLYLTLGGGKNLIENVAPFPYPFVLQHDKINRNHNTVYTTHDALAYLGNSTKLGETVDTANPNAPQRSGNYLEAIVAVAMEIASHENGVEGIQLPDFILALATELAFETPFAVDKKFKLSWSENQSIRLEEQFRELKIPYLSPAGADWPKSLYDVGNELFVGYLVRTANKTQIDLGVKIKESSKEYVVSGEAKNYATKISLDVVKGCLLRMKSRIHFCIVSQLQNTYFTKKDAWESFKIQEWKLLDANVNINVQKVNVLRVKVNKPLFTIELQELVATMKLVPWKECEGIVVFMDMNDLNFMDLKDEQCTITTVVNEKRGKKSSKQPAAAASKKHKSNMAEENIAIPQSSVIANATDVEYDVISKKFKIVDVGGGGDCFPLCVQDQLKIRRNMILGLSELRNRTAESVKAIFEAFYWEEVEKVRVLCDELRWRSPTKEEDEYGIWEYANLNRNKFESDWEEEDTKQSVINAFSNLIRMKGTWYDEPCEAALATALDVGIALYRQHIDTVTTKLNFAEDKNQSILHILYGLEAGHFYSLHDLGCECGKCK